MTFHQDMSYASSYKKVQTRIAASHAPLSMGFCMLEYWNVLPCPPPGNFLKPGVEPRSPTLQEDSLLTEPGKPKNTGVGSLSLLQRIFLTQESNFLHCRWILYQLSYQGSPYKILLRCFPFFFSCYIFETWCVFYTYSTSQLRSVTLQMLNSSVWVWGFKMGNTHTPTADSCQCMAKTTTIL